MLLIQRGKEPSKGQWSFPGGSLELGLLRNLQHAPRHRPACPVPRHLRVSEEPDADEILHRCLRVGETMVECAEREMIEETGLKLRNVGAIGPRRDIAAAVYTRMRSHRDAHFDARADVGMLAGGGIISAMLDVPTPFAAADVIVREGDGNRVAFHYAIVEVAARVEDPHAPPVAADDVDDARWVPVDQLDSFPGSEAPLPHPNLNCRSPYICGGPDARATPQTLDSVLHRVCVADAGRLPFVRRCAHQPALAPPWVPRCPRLHSPELHFVKLRSALWRSLPHVDCPVLAGLAVNIATVAAEAAARFQLH